MYGKLYMKHDHLHPHPRPAEQRYFTPLQFSVIHIASSQCMQGEDLYIQASSSGSVGTWLLEEEIFRAQHRFLTHHHLQI